MLTSRFWITLTLLTTIAVAACQAAERPGRVVMVVAGNVSIRDLADSKLPHLRHLLLKGSGGLMNVRTGKPGKLTEPATTGMEAGCLTVGAGALASGGAEISRAYGAESTVDGSTAKALYELRSGRSVGSAEIVHTEVVLIQRQNAEAAYRARPGALGEALHKAGIKTAVVGNSSLPGSHNAEAVAIAMDESGSVDSGCVDSASLLESDTAAPYGVRADIDSYLREIDRALPWRRLVVVDFGDTCRADLYCHYCTEARAARLRHEAAVRLDNFIGTLATRLNFDRDTLILLSPGSRTYSEIEEERLTPIFVRGPGFRGGLLASPSTRRPGLVTNCDVAPTVLRILHAAQPAEMVGRPASTLPHLDPLAALLKLNLDASRQGQRQIAMRGSGVAQSVIVVLVTVVLLLATLPRLRAVASWCALIPATLPLAMLYLPALYTGGLAGSVAVLIALVLLILLSSAVVLRSPMRALAWLCVAIVGTVLVDLARGAPLISSSIAGYSLVEGARYYGIGNELMGTLIGATIIASGVCVPRVKPIGRIAALLVPLVFVLVFVVMALPTFGAELGGSGAMVAAAAVTLLVLRGWRLNARSVPMIIALAVFGVIAAFGLDAMRGGGDQSHVGRAAGLLTGGDAMALWQVAQRKAALNLMLVSTSVWSKLLGLSVLASALIYWRKLHRSDNVALVVGEKAALAGCIVAVVFAFAFNDSGVLAAAACAVFGWTFLVIKAS